MRWVMSLLYLISKLLHVSALVCHLQGTYHVLVSYLKAEISMLFVIYCECWWAVCPGCCGSVCYVVSWAHTAYLYNFRPSSCVLSQLRPINIASEYRRIVVLVSDVDCDLSCAWQGSLRTDFTSFYLQLTESWTLYIYQVGVCSSTHIAVRYR
jgi:hypothetical protein